MIIILQLILFQSTPPRRRRLNLDHLQLRRGGGFNPRLHAGGDIALIIILQLILFQSTPPRRRRLNLDHLQLRRGGGFNPRLHAGGDSTIIHPGGAAVVSIHASTQEATQAQPLRSAFENVFQSTPPRRRRHRGAGKQQHCDESFNPRLHAGGDKSSAAFSRSYQPFQSTPPRRRRPATTWLWFERHGVSIHASTQEATSSPGHGLDFYYCFNPRLHAGGDLGSVAGRLSRSCFNPRLHAGGDISGKPTITNVLVSIHASTQEATPGTTPRTAALIGFNPRLHAGGDVKTGAQIPDCKVSIHASTQEATSRG